MRGCVRRAMDGPGPESFTNGCITTLQRVHYYQGGKESRELSQANHRAWDRPMGGASGRVMQNRAQRPILFSQHRFHSHPNRETMADIHGQAKGAGLEAKVPTSRSIDRVAAPPWRARPGAGSDGTHRFFLQHQHPRSMRLVPLQKQVLPRRQGHLTPFLRRGGKGGEQATGKQEEMMMPSLRPSISPPLGSPRCLQASSPAGLRFCWYKQFYFSAN